MCRILGVWMALLWVGAHFATAEPTDALTLDQHDARITQAKAGYQTDRESLLNLVASERSLLHFELEYHRAKVAAGKSRGELEWVGRRPRDR